MRVALVAHDCAFEMNITEQVLISPTSNMDIAARMIEEISLDPMPIGIRAAGAETQVGFAAAICQAVAEYFRVNTDKLWEVYCRKYKPDLISHNRVVFTQEVANFLPENMPF